MQKKNLSLFDGVRSPKNFIFSTQVLSQKPCQSQNGKPKFYISMRNIFILLTLAFLFTIGCSKPRNDVDPNPKPKVKSGVGIGHVDRISDDKKIIHLTHNDIPGIMEAMSMQYELASPDLVKDIKQGDSVTFTLTKAELGDFIITSIKKK